MNRYDAEYRTLPVFWSWVALLLFTAAILTWGMLSHMFIKERRREWDFGAVPETPGASVFSTQLPERSAPVPPQLDPPLGIWPDPSGLQNPAQPGPQPGYEEGGR